MLRQDARTRMRGQGCSGGNARAGMPDKTFLLFLHPDSFRRIDTSDIRSRACREVANRSRKGRRNLRAGAQTNGKAERRPQGTYGCNRAGRNRSGLANGRAGAAPRNEPRTDGLKHAARKDAPDSGSERQIETRIESWRGIHGTGRTPPPSRQRVPCPAPPDGRPELYGQDRKHGLETTAWKAGRAGL